MTEFFEYSLGMDRISERDLALFLLRFANLKDDVNKIALKFLAHKLIRDTKI
jgi:hypothetical protein